MNALGAWGGTKALDPKVVLLRSVPSLAGARDRDLATVAPLVDDLRVEAGAVLAREGDTCHELVLILEGQATVSVGGVVHGTLGMGDLVGDAALLQGVPHATTVVAASPLRVLVAGPESQRALLHHPVVRQAIAGSLTRRVRLQNQGS